MHTSGGGDVIDEYLESIVERDGAWFYRYDGGLRPLTAVPITVPYKLASGAMGAKTITVYYSQHGPIVRALDGKWVAVRLMHSPMKALMQSYTRTKAHDYAAFYKTMELRTNSSNNTVYADADGNIAYFHGNFIPVRDPRFNWKQPVDGSDPATEWKGLHTVAQTITLFNPKNGWIQNTSNWPYSAAGSNSPRQHDYPAYMSVNGENARGLHAVKVFQNRTGFTLDSLIAASSDSELTAFEALSENSAQKLALADKIALLRAWDWRYALTSTATSLAVFWGQELAELAGKQAREQGVPVVDFMATDKVTAQQRLAALATAADKLQRDFGHWQTPWGEINRYQRLTGDIVQPFDDAQASLPVPYASGNWGALAAYGQSSKSTTKRMYGERGNSFVAAVEFGPRIRAKSILAGGQSGDPKSPHFQDQAAMYARGQFKEVLFYPEEVARHLERRYRPGE